MITNIKFTNTEHDDRLREYAQQKVDAFAKLLTGDDLAAAVCNIEFSKSTHHQSGDVCVAEVTLEAGGRLYRATKEEKTLEKAIDKVKDDILEELRTDKGKSRDKYLKGAATAKEWLREGKPEVAE